MFGGFKGFLKKAKKAFTRNKDDNEDEEEVRPPTNPPTTATSPKPPSDSGSSLSRHIFCFPGSGSNSKSGSSETTSLSDRSPPSKRDEKKKKKNVFKRIFSKSKKTISKSSGKVIEVTKASSRTAAVATKATLGAVKDGGVVAGDAIVSGSKATASEAATIAKCAKNHIVKRKGHVKDVFKKRTFLRKLRKRLIPEKATKDTGEVSEALAELASLHAAENVALVCLCFYFLGEQHRPFPTKQLAKTRAQIGEAAVQSVQPKDYGRWVDKHTKHQMATSDELDAEGSRIIVAAGLRAAWSDADALEILDAAFLVCPNRAEHHPFFGLRVDLASYRTERFEAWSIPLDVENCPAETEVSFVVLRPTFVTDIVNLANKLTGIELETALDKLASAKRAKQSVLLPRFQVKNQQDLLAHWQKRLVVTDEHVDLLAPLQGVEHWATLGIQRDGVTFGDGPGVEELPAGKKLQRDVRSLFTRHRSYNLRLDSPFLFFVVVQETVLNRIPFREAMSISMMAVPNIFTNLYLSCTSLIALALNFTTDPTTDSPSPTSSTTTFPATPSASEDLSAAIFDD
ncbi:unnamed protein product, partial [Mesorhabditis spiculigera]